MKEKQRHHLNFSLRTVFLLVTLAALCLWWLRVWERPTAPNLDALKVGMTAEQVWQIIGQAEAGGGGIYRWTDLYNWPGYGSARVEYIGRRLVSVRPVRDE